VVQFVVYIKISFYLDDFVKALKYLRCGCPVYLIIIILIIWSWYIQNALCRNIRALLKLKTYS